jgi:hypothetical protein
MTALPLKFVDTWDQEANQSGKPRLDYIATQAVRRGADQELEACCEWLREARNHGLGYDIGRILADNLRAARRPKPPSLAEQAQRILVENGTTLDGRIELDPDDIITIRAALERLQELESND